MYLLDTNTVIDFCNAKLPENARKFLSKVSPIISVIARIEMFGKLSIEEDEKIRLEQFIEIAEVINLIDVVIIEKTIGIRQKYKTPLPDAIIAGSALALDFTLITRNTADYKNIEGLKIINPYEIEEDSVLTGLI